MSGKPISFAIILLLAVTLIIAWNTRHVEADGPIYITTDGSVTTTLIQRNGDLYTLNGNVTESSGIVIQRDNIVLDGAGYTLIGPSYRPLRTAGIDLEGRNKVTVKNIIIQSFDDGIHIANSNGSTIIQNCIKRNYAGIRVWSSYHNTIRGNNVTDQDGFGIEIDSSSNNTFSQNRIVDNHLYGIYLGKESPDNVITENTFLNDGLYVYTSLPNTVTDNLVNGKPLVYLRYASNVIINNAGQVVLLECDHMRVENLDVRNATDGVLLFKTNNTQVSNNNISANEIFGIDVWESHGNAISCNNITATETEGISVRYSSGNFLIDNQIVSNSEGVYLGHSSSNYLSQNNLAYNAYGITIEMQSNFNVLSDNNFTLNSQVGLSIALATNNSVFHNNFLNNTNQFYCQTSGTIWDSGYPSGGNYWSDYNGTDKFSGPFQNETGPDGIGDIPYLTDTENADHFPLMTPHIYVNGDLNGDGAVDIQDAITFARAFGSQIGGINWNPAADMNLDGMIDIYDAIALVSHFGKY